MLLKRPIEPIQKGPVGGWCCGRAEEEAGYGDGIGYVEEDNAGAVIMLDEEGLG